MQPDELMTERLSKDLHIFDICMSYVRICICQKHRETRVWTQCAADQFNDIYYRAKANSQVKGRQGSEPGISLKQENKYKFRGITQGAQGKHKGEK